MVLLYAEKRIGSPFDPNFRWWPVAGKHCHVVSQRKYFFPDLGYQLIDISAGQITSPDAPGKKDIAADEQFVLAREETKTPRAMSGNVQNLEIGAEKISVWRFFDEKIRFRRFDFEFEPKIPKKFPVGNHRCGERVTTNRTTKLLLDPGNILDVIDMPVCQEQKFRLDLKRTHPSASALRRVEEDLALWRFKQIAIRFENAAAKAFVTHMNSLYRGVATTERVSFYEY